MNRKDSRRGGRLGTFCYHALFGLAITYCSGCNLCCPPYLDDYATVGGKWSRANPTEGRVGSAFSDPGEMTASAEVPGHVMVGEGAPITLTPDDGEVIIEPTEESPMILGEGW